MYTVEAPKAYSMIGDLVIARPLLIGATVLGAAAFVVSLPFTALGGNVGEGQGAGGRAGQGSLRTLPGLHHQRLQRTELTGIIRTATGRR